MRILLLMLLLTGCAVKPATSPSSAPQSFKQPPLPKALVADRPATPNNASLVATPTTPVTLAWDAVAAPGVGGYRLYQGGITRTYTNQVDVGNALLGVLNALQGTNYFAVTAYLTNGDESSFSAEVSYVAPEPAPIVAYISTFVETNTTLTGPWGQVAAFPTVIITNPPPLIYFRTRVAVDTHGTQ